MAYDALEVMEKANQIYEVEELSPGKQLSSFIIWAIEICLVVAFILYIL
ncbi:MAG: hypothetical protein JRI95_11615 [Deltaproteobacteria bacterium]|nr:hypothetical protein [Deltaproteobacteria bacterium]